MRASSRHAQLMGALLALAVLPSAYAVIPLPTYPECGKDNDVDQCPPDLSRADGTWNGHTWEKVSFIPPADVLHVRPQEIPLGSGNGIDVAWRYTTGRYDVTVAVIDSGIMWDDWGLQNKFRLNQGELPLPQKADGSTCAAYDCNGDGFFNVQDYASDPRVKITAGVDISDSMLEPSDLIATFSDGKDTDGNGYVDDICGWDFMWDDNQPYSSNGFDHGTGVMQDITAEGGQQDSDIGICPNCTILPVRTGDSFMHDGDRMAQGIIYATDLGVKVIAMASGLINNPLAMREALKYAYDHGVMVVVAIGDENSFHHLYPGAYDYVMAVHSIRYYPLATWDRAWTYLQYNGCNNYGSHLTVVAGTTSCATGATGITAGSAALLFSRARDLGIELHPDEVRALLVNSATDIDIPANEPGPWFPSRKGWDLFFGYGRVNVGKALQNFQVPPQVHLTSPGWYQYLDATTLSSVPIQAHLAAPHSEFYTWTLEWAPGGDAADTDFTMLTSGQSNAAIDGTIFNWSLSAIPRDKLDPAVPLEQITADDDMAAKFGKINVHTITLRLTSEDAEGNRAEMRKSFFLHAEPDLLPGFPVYLGGSGQSSPWMDDVDGDGVKDIIIGAAAGVVHVFDGATGHELPGWPVQMPYTKSLDPANANGHSKAKAYASGKMGLIRQAVLATVVSGDLDNDGQLELIAATMDGRLFVYGPTGQLKAGFPVSRDAIGDADTDYTTWYDPGMLSSPELADLDGDGRLEIVQAAMDQKVYVWRWDGSRQPGFPVKLENADSATHIKGRIVSSPVFGDLDRDGVLDIVIGSNEYNPELYNIPGFAYALSGLGMLDPRGPILPGWPVDVPGAINGVVPFIGEGVTANPVVADLDGDGRLEVEMSGTASCPHIYQANGKRGMQFSCNALEWNDPSTSEAIAITMISNPWMADVDGDGVLEMAAAMSGAKYATVLGTSTWLDHQDHVIGLWNARTGESLPGWPVVVEDLALFMQPRMADVDGDGLAEVIASSGGYTVHAFDMNGMDVPGWPKLTGGMIASALMVGDVNGDGYNDVAAVTNEGYLFAWSTNGRATTTAAKFPASERRVDAPKGKRVRQVWRGETGPLKETAPGEKREPIRKAHRATLRTTEPMKVSAIRGKHQG